MVKTNTKGLYKGTIHKLTNNFTGGYYLVLRSKPVVPSGRPLIAIVYKYNVHNVLYFIVTEYTGSKKAGTHYLSK